MSLPRTSSNADLVNEHVTALPKSPASPSNRPRYHVHIHGGAWRDPFLLSRSIEAVVAHAFEGDGTLEAIISMNYTISPFPTHRTAPYDLWKVDDPGQLQISDADRDVAREARHPMHIRDVSVAFEKLRALGLADDNFILSGHSCGACIMFQTILQPPSCWSLPQLPSPSRPAALIGMNGLYEFPALVYDLGSSHEKWSEEYKGLQSIAFGQDGDTWKSVSPARFAREDLQARLQSGEGSVPRLVFIEQSTEDQLVPMNQMTRLKENFERVHGLRVVVGDRYVGRQAAPWEEGYMIWDSVRDVLGLLEGT